MKSGLLKFYITFMSPFAFAVNQTVLPPLHFEVTVPFLFLNSVQTLFNLSFWFFFLKDLQKKNTHVLKKLWFKVFFQTVNIILAPAVFFSPWVHQFFAVLVSSDSQSSNDMLRCCISIFYLSKHQFQQSFSFTFSFSLRHHFCWGR